MLLLPERPRRRLRGVDTREPGLGLLRRGVRERRADGGGGRPLARLVQRDEILTLEMLGLAYLAHLDGVAVETGGPLGGPSLRLVLGGAPRAVRRQHRPPAVVVTVRAGARARARALVRHDPVPRVPPRGVRLQRRGRPASPDAAVRRGLGVVRHILSVYRPVRVPRGPVGVPAERREPGDGGGVIRRERDRRGVARRLARDGGTAEGEDGLEGRAL